MGRPPKAKCRSTGVSGASRRIVLPIRSGLAREWRLTGALCAAVPFVPGVNGEKLSAPCSSTRSETATFPSWDNSLCFPTAPVEGATWLRFVCCVGSHQVDVSGTSCLGGVPIHGGIASGLRRGKRRCAVVGICPFVSLRWGGLSWAITVARVRCTGRRAEAFAS